MLFAAFFSGVEVALPFLHGLLPISNGLFAVLSFAAVVLAFISRFVAQPQSLPPVPPETKPNQETGE